MSDFDPSSYANVPVQSNQPATAEAFDPSTYAAQEHDPATYGNHDSATVSHMAADPSVDPADLLGSFETQPLAIQIFKERANQPASIASTVEGAKDFTKGFVKAIPSSVASLGKGTYDWFRNLGEMGVGTVRAGGDINNPQTQRAETENAAAVDLIGQNLVSQVGGIGRNASRLANILTGGTYGQRDKDLTDEQILDRLWTQKSAKDTLKSTLQGHSSLSDAGLVESPEQLANEGYPIRSDDIQSQASAANPENLLPIGAVIRPGVAAKIAGYGLQGTGKAIESVGTGLGTAAGGGKSWIAAAYEAVHGDPTTALAAAVAPYVAKGLTKTGGFIKSAGAELTLAPEERAMLDDFNNLGGIERSKVLDQATKLLQAGATGSVAMAPFTASDETPEQVGSTLGSGFGLGLMGQGAHDATILGRQKAFDSYFKTVNNNGNPLVDLSTQSRDYGTDPSMDAAHNQSMSDSPPEEQDTINQIRHLMQGKYEVYQLPADKFNLIIQQLNPDADAQGVAMADFNGKPTILIRQGALPQTKWHEILHPVYDALSPEAKAEVDKASFSRNDPDAFASSYQTQLTGKPTDVKYDELPPEQQQQVRSEMAAETLGNLSIAQITQKPSIARQIQGLLGRTAESLGLPTTTGEVRSIIGVQPTFKAAYVLENALRDQASKIGPVNYGSEASPATTTLPTDKNVTTASLDNENTDIGASQEPVSPPQNLSDLRLDPDVVKKLKKQGFSDEVIAKMVDPTQPSQLSEVRAPNSTADDPTASISPESSSSSQDNSSPLSSLDVPSSEPIRSKVEIPAIYAERALQSPEEFLKTSGIAGTEQDKLYQHKIAVRSALAEGLPVNPEAARRYGLTPSEKPSWTIRGDTIVPGDQVHWMSGGSWDGIARDAVRKQSGNHDVLVKASNGDEFWLRDAEHYGISKGNSDHINGANKPEYEGWEKDYPNLAPETHAAQPDLHAIRLAAEEAKRTELAGTKRKTKDQEIQKAGLMAMAKAHSEGNFMPTVPSDSDITEALSSDKKSLVGAARNLPLGTPIGVRIDIPAYERNGTYVQTVHEKAKGNIVGKRIGYDGAVMVDNPSFMSNERGAEKIRDGHAKFPIATVEGNYDPVRTPPEDLENWTKVGFNPKRHSYFYDKSTGEPVESGSKAFSQGNTVYVKDPVYGRSADHRFQPSTDKVTYHKDRFGKESIYGSKLDPSDPFHQHLISLAGLTPKQVDTINKFTDNKGNVVGIENYSHAVKEDEPTAVSRKKEQALNPAQERADETGKAQNAPLNIIPSSISFKTPSNVFTLHGFNVDKFFANAKKLLEHPETGASKVYDGINDPQWTKDVQTYRENNNNGYSGDGRKKLTGTEATPIEVNEDYKPQVIPTDRFQVLNAAFGQPAPKGKTGKGLDTLQLGKQNAAFVFPDSGEFNQVRNKMGADAKLLESTSETLRPENIRGEIGRPVADEHLLRPSGVKPEQLQSFGKPPRADYISGGFLPSDKNLVAVHNLSEANLEHADKMGGIPLPSIAITRADRAPFNNFGDISLVGHPDMIKPSKDMRVLDADAYSPRYPDVKHFLDKGSSKKLQDFVGKTIDSIPGAYKSFSRYDVGHSIEGDGIFEGLKNDAAMQLAYLKDTGQEIPALDKDGKYEVRKLVGYSGPENAKFQTWLQGKIKDLGLSADEKIFNGFTNSGNRRYLKHDLDTVVKLMKKGFRDGEGFNYGAGNVRATAAKQFRTVKEIQASRDKIVSSDQMEELKNEANDGLTTLADEVMPLRTNPIKGFGAYDAFSDDLKALASGGMKNHQYLREQYGDNLGKATDKMRGYLEKLKNMPTEYFEAKSKRAMGLHEFTGAAVPKDAQPETIAALKKHGLDIEPYDSGNQDSRRQAVENLASRHNALFQPSTDPRAIKEAAIKINGKTYTGPMHFNAILDAQKDGVKNFSNLDRGWITNSGEYLSDEDAHKRAIEIGQTTQAKLDAANKYYGNDTLPGSKNKLESLSFSRAKKKSLKDLFLPGK